MPNGNSVRSIAIDQMNRIYCGGSGYFGYLTYLPSGQVQFVDLCHDLPDLEVQSFSTIENIYCTSKGVFFRSQEKIFQYDQERQLTSISAEENSFLETFWVDGQLLVNRKNLGIQVLTDSNTFRPLHDEGVLIGELVTTILPHNRGLLIGSSEDLFLWKENRLTHFESSADEFVSQARLYKGRVLNDHTFVLSTLNKGMLIINEKGDILLQSNRQNGLPSNTVYSVYQGLNDRIWIATSNGFTVMEYPTAMTGFGIGNKTPPISALEVFQNDVIVGTLNGLYRVQNPNHPPANLAPFLDVKDRIWDLKTVDSTLFIGHEDGLLIHTKGKPLQKLEDDAISVIFRSELDARRVFIGSRKGIYAYSFLGGAWKRETINLSLEESVYNIHEQKNGTLWLDVNKTWIYKISFESLDHAHHLSNPILTKLDTANGLPGVKGYTMMYDDQVFYINNEAFSMLAHDADNDYFESIQEGPFDAISKGKHIVIAHTDKQNNHWIVEFEESGKIKNTFLKSAENEIQKLSESRIYDQIGRCFLFDTDFLWHGGRDMLIRNDARVTTSLLSFHTLIENVTYQTDSIVVKGPNHSGAFKFPFSRNSFRFTYASTANVANDRTLYQYRLDGWVDEWSEWTEETTKDFNNLIEGSYRFRVRSQSLGSVVGEEDVFSFTIIAPWYRSWWAYVLYILGGIFTISLIVKWRIATVNHENLHLQKVVEKRTIELRDRNKSLQEQTNLLARQAVQLQEMDDFKSNLFANISHEFRTPLTLIKGPLGYLKESPDNHLEELQIEMMDRNADRLLQLVNQILDLSKMDAQDLPLELVEGNILGTIRASGSCFVSHATDRGIEYKIHVPSGERWTRFDKEKLEKVLYNLLSNAFKFTNSPGRVELFVVFEDQGLHIKVEDSGIGIDKAELTKIFDRFYQVNTGDRKNNGSGLGLSLVRELVHLMQGTIDVQSRPEKGTTFHVFIPMEFADKHVDIHQQNPLSSPRKTKPLKDRKGKSGVKILLVEDNKDMRSHIRSCLKPSDYVVIEAQNGKEAHQLAIEAIPDLIVSDVIMPHMSGLELCALIKSDLRTSHIPIIVLTAKVGMSNKIEGLEKGADVYLTKPFDAKELLTQIERLLENRNRLRAHFSSRYGVEPKDINVPGIDEQFIRKLHDILEEHHSDPKLQISLLHERLAMSRTQFHRKLKSLTGMAPSEFVRNFRLRRAAKMLDKGERTSQTAYAVGFNNLSYFARSFRTLHGMSPSEYARLRNKN